MNYMYPVCIDTQRQVESIKTYMGRKSNQIRVLFSWRRKVE